MQADWGLSAAEDQGLLDVFSCLETMLCCTMTSVDQCQQVSCKCSNAVVSGVVGRDVNVLHALCVADPRG